MKPTGRLRAIMIATQEKRTTKIDISTCTSRLILWFRNQTNRHLLNFQATLRLLRSSQPRRRSSTRGASSNGRAHFQRSRLWCSIRIKHWCSWLMSCLMKVTTQEISAKGRLRRKQDREAKHWEVDCWTGNKRGISWSKESSSFRS